MIDDLTDPTLLAELQRDHATETADGCRRGAAVIAVGFCALAYVLVATATHCDGRRRAPLPAAAQVRSALASPSTALTDGV